MMVFAVIPRQFVSVLVYSLPVQVAALAVVLSVYGIARSMGNEVGAVALWWLAVLLMMGTVTCLIALVTCLGLHFLEETAEKRDSSEPPIDDELGE